MNVNLMLMLAKTLINFNLDTFYISSDDIIEAITIEIQTIQPSRSKFEASSHEKFSLMKSSSNYFVNFNVCLT